MMRKPNDEELEALEKNGWGYNPSFNMLYKYLNNANTLMISDDAELDKELKNINYKQVR